jgi:hypothetical protein
MAKHSILREFVYFIKAEKKWWLIPLFVVGAALGALFLFAQNAGPLSVLIYPLF